MKQLLLLILLPLVALADETLTLTWNQPPGYESTLYSSTNLNGTWTPLGPVNPPVQVTTTNQVTFFYVNVIPTNTVNSLLIYTNDPNSDGLTPQFTNKPAMAYSENGGGIWLWSVTAQNWN